MVERDGATAPRVRAPDPADRVPGPSSYPPPAQHWRPDAYPASQVPHIATVPLPLSVGGAARIEAVTAAIARFDSRLALLPAPLADVPTRAEGVCSATAAGIRSATAVIARAEIGRTGRGHARRIAHTIAATAAARQHPGPVDGAALLTWSDILARGSDGTVTDWRPGPVDPGDRWSDDGLAPAHHDQVPALVDDLVAFLHRRDLPQLAQAAVGYAQWCTIAPLTSGNGRIGRALIQYLLHAAGLIRTGALPLSIGLVADPSAHERALRRYRRGRPDAVVDWLLRTCADGMDRLDGLLDQLQRLRSQWHGRVRARRGASTWPLADLLLRHPVVDAGTIARELGIAQQNTHRAIRPLVEARVLIEITGSTRMRVWQAPEVVSTWDAFLASVRRG